MNSDFQASKQSYNHRSDQINTIDDEVLLILDKKEIIYRHCHENNKYFGQRDVKITHHVELWQSGFRSLT